MFNDKGMAGNVTQPLKLILKREIFSDHPRFTIMFLIFLNKTIGFTELQRLLKITPGNLDHHIKKLERAGYVKIRKKISWRPLNVVEITHKGVEAFRNYTSDLKRMLEEIK